MKEPRVGAYAYIPVLLGKNDVKASCHAKTLTTACVPDVWAPTMII